VWAEGNKRERVGAKRGCTDGGEVEGGVEEWWRRRDRGGSKK